VIGLLHYPATLASGRAPIGQWWKQDGPLDLVWTLWSRYHFPLSGTESQLIGRPPHSQVTNLISVLSQSSSHFPACFLMIHWTRVSYLSLDLSRRLSLWKFPTNKLYFLALRNRYRYSSVVQRFKWQYRAEDVFRSREDTQLVTKFPVYEPVPTAPVVNHTMTLHTLKAIYFI